MVRWLWFVFCGVLSVGYVCGVLSAVCCLGVVCGVLCVALFAGCNGSKADNTGRFTVGENDRPTLTIESPAEGEVLETTAVTVEGAAPGLTEVAINGQPFRVVEGRFSAELEFAEGSRAVRVEGEGVTPQSVNFFVDLSPPIITLTTPEPGRFVEGFEGDQLLFRGEVFDAGAGVERVEIGGFPVQLAADGRFEATVPLNVGGNVLDVRAYDKAGREAVALRGAVYGDFTPWELPTDDSLYGHVAPETFDVVEDAPLFLAYDEAEDRVFSFLFDDDDDDDDDVVNLSNLILCIPTTFTIPFSIHTVLIFLNNNFISLFSLTERLGLYFGSHFLRSNPCFFIYLFFQEVSCLELKEREREREMCDTRRVI